MPTTITGTTIVTTAITGSAISLTGGTQSLITPTAGTSGYYGLRAWANVHTANTSTCSYVGYNISGISLVSTGLWDITFTTAGYANTNSVAMFVLNGDSNYDIMYQYDKNNSSTSKIRIRCVINNNTLYTPSAYTVCVVW